MRDRSILPELAAAITDVERPLWSLGAETSRLHELVGERAAFQIDAHRDISAGETRADAGLAISPTQAAMCASEVARTAAFIRGAAQAVNDKLAHARSAGRPLHVLYAGCGPFALLAVPLMSLFPPGQIQFTLLDIHEQSITSARSVVESLDFAKHVTGYVCQDACQYDLAAGPEPDIIMSETMNVCLGNEPLVAIACHLLGQSAKAVLIPNRVRVDACLVDRSKEFELVEAGYEGELPQPPRDRIFLGTVFELNGETARRWGSSPRDPIPASPVTIPTALEERYRPMLLTIVNVYGNVSLRDYDCSLTIPRPINAGQELRGGERLRFAYRLGNNPGLACRVADRD